MTAKVEINVTGNAVREVTKLSKALDKVEAEGKGAAATLTKVETATAKTGGRARDMGRLQSSLSKLILATNALTGAIRKADPAFVSTARSTKKIGDEAKKAAAENDKLATSVEKVTRAEGRRARAVASSRGGRQTSGGGGAQAGGVSLSQMGSMLAGAISLGLSRTRAFQAMLGIQGREEMAGQYVDYEQRLIRLTNQAGMRGEERTRFNNTVLETARRTMVDPNEVLAGMEVAQNRFSNLDFFVQNAEQFAGAANALNTPLADVVGAVGEFQRQMGVTANEVPELIGMLTQAARNGSIEMNNISSEFTTVIGNYARATGQSGMEGARGFIAMSQALGAAGASPSETATLAQNLLAKLSDPEVMKGLRRAGVRTHEDVIDPATGRVQRDARGRAVQRFVGMDRLIQGIATNRTLGASGEAGQVARRRVFGRDLQANTAFGTLLSQVQTASSSGQENPLTALMNSSAAEGNQVIADTQRDLRNSTSGRVIEQRVNAQVNFLENGREFIEATNSAAGALANLETKFPRLAEAVETVTTALSGLAALSLFKGIAGGGAGVAVGGGLLGGGGTGVAVGSTGVAAGGAGLGLGSLGGLATLGLGGFAYLMGDAYQEQQRELGGIRAFENEDGSIDHEDLARTRVANREAEQQQREAARNQMWQQSPLAQQLAARAPATSANPVQGDGGLPAQFLQSMEAQTRATEAQTAELRGIRTNTAARPPTGAVEPQ